LALRYQAAKLKKGVTKLEVKTRQGQTAH
jgi:hypothetical protein